MILALLEIILVFIGIPLLYKYDFIPFHKSIPLAIVFLLYLAILLTDKKFTRKYFTMNGFRKWKPVIIRTTVFFLLSVCFVAYFKPENLFIIVKEKPFIWIMIMIFYPVWSAYPQELIYRAYFFHRFSKYANNKLILIIINSLLFSFSHIIFNNWIALILTFAGNFFLVNTYRKSNSLMVVFIEHAVYGNIIFTTGLGEYFYLPMSAG